MGRGPYLERMPLAKVHIEAQDCIAYLSLVAHQSFGSCVNLIAETSVCGLDGRVDAWFVRDGKRQAQQYQRILRLSAVGLQFVNIVHTCTQNTRRRRLLLDILCRRAWSSNDSTDFGNGFFRGGCHLEIGMRVSDGGNWRESYSISELRGMADRIN
jgi:hypothetical protein